MLFRSVKLPISNKNITQNKNGITVTSDSEFLFEVVLKEAAEDLPFNVLEIGTGNGVVSIMLALHRLKWRITALEVQIPLFQLAEKNCLDTKADIELILGDIRKHDLFLEERKFDMIVTNPPYYKAGTGRLSNDIVKNIGKFELLCSMEELVQAIASRLNEKGLAFIIYPVSREKELYKYTEKHNLRVIKIIDEDKRGTNQETEKAKTRFDRKVYIIQKNGINH